MERLKKTEIINRYNKLLQKWRDKCGEEFAHRFNKMYKLTDELLCCVNENELNICDIGTFIMIPVYNDDMIPSCFEFHKQEEKDGELKITEKYYDWGWRIDDD